MTENGNGRYVTTKWLVAILAALMFAASGMLIQDTRSGVSEARSKIDTLQKEKVDKDQYDKDILEIKHGISRLINMHLKQ